MGKFIGVLVLVALFVVLFFPRWIPRLFRRFGRALGDAGRVGKEIVTGEEVPGSPLARYEIEAGRILVERTLRDSRPPGDRGCVRDTEEIGRALAARAARREIPYRFLVIEGSEPNAFAVPGGTVFLTSALVDLCRSDRSLVAGVLGHEIAHIDRRHALQNLAAKWAAKAGSRLLLMGRAAILSHVVGGIEELIVQGYRQDQEFEADLAGARLAGAAGFDPRGLARLLDRLGGDSEEVRGTLAEVCQYFRSHPPVHERIRRLEKEFGPAQG